MEDTNKKDCQKKIIYVPMAQTLEGMEGFQNEDEIDLLELWKILWAGKWFVMGFTLACTLVAVYVTLFVLPVIYKSDAVLLPNKSESNTGLSALAANLPISLPGKSGETDKVMAFLQSRTLKSRLIEKYDLLPRYYPDIWDSDKNQWMVKEESEKPSLVKALQNDLLKNTFLVNSDDKTGLITVSWVDQDPEFCKKMVNRVISELKFFLENEYETDAERERRFVETQLAKTTQTLEYWERQIPTENLTLTKIRREQLATQTVYTELRKQLEIARITEAKEVINFKILDSSFVPEQRFKPARSRICLLTIIASGMFSVFLVFGYRFIANLKTESDNK